MHTYSACGTMQDGREVEVVIHHNGDYSGDAHLSVKTLSTSHAFEINVPCHTLVGFVRDAVRNDMMDKLQEMD